MVGRITIHCIKGRMAVVMESDTSDLCRFCENREEIEPVENILCPRLQISSYSWPGSRFLDELGDVSGSRLENSMGFVMGMIWLL